MLFIFYFMLVCAFTNVNERDFIVKCYQKSFFDEVM